MADNVKRAYVLFQGSQHIATYDESSGLWSVDIVAPAESSWPQPGHVFLAEIHAEDEAGNTVKMDSTDDTYGDLLKIRVLEKTAPTATILYPTDGSVLGSSTVDIKLRLQDAGGSGLNMDSVEFTVNGEPISDLSWEDTAGEKNATYHAESLTNGNNTITLQVTDNDGNESTLASTTFIISTAAPSLDVLSPREGLVTNEKTITVTGVSMPGSSYVTIASVTINDEPAVVEISGEFSHELTLTEGSNEIVIVATDSAGLTTTVRRTVILDTIAPIITDVIVEPSVVDASGTIHIVFRVIDNG